MLIYSSEYEQYILRSVINGVLSSKLPNLDLQDVEITFVYLNIEEPPQNGCEVCFKLNTTKREEMLLDNNLVYDFYTALQQLNIGLPQIDYSLKPKFVGVSYLFEFLIQQFVYSFKLTF